MNGRGGRERVVGWKGKKKREREKGGGVGSSGGWVDSPDGAVTNSLICQIKVTR